MNIFIMPAINASLNAASAVLLAAGFVFIKKGNKSAHRACMVSAFGTSVVFLACYLFYHFSLYWTYHRGPTRFLHPHWFRPIYIFILSTHTVLAMVIVPLILSTLWMAAKGRFETHRKLARWTWPLWMYVSITGVLVYFLLYRIFPQS